MQERYMLAIMFCFGILMIQSRRAYSEESLSSDEREIIDSVIAEAEAGRMFETTYTETVWQYEEDGKKTFVHAISSKDQFGRYRCRQQSGTGQYTPDHEFDAWEELICDGDVFASVSEFQSSNNHEESPEAQLLRAMIFDASEAAPYPEPLQIGDFTTNLKAALNSGSVVKITSKPASGDSMSIEFERNDIYDDKGPVYSVLIDLTQSSPVAILKEVRGKEGPLISRSTVEYRDMGNGKMLAKSEIFEMFAGPNKLKRTHDLIDARIDAPGDFPEETFDIELPAGTVVWDKRHATEYILKSDQVINNKLDELAMEAKAEQAVRPELKPSNLMMEKMASEHRAETTDVISQASIRWQFILLANVVILAIIFAYWKYRTGRT